MSRYAVYFVPAAASALAAFGEAWFAGRVRLGLAETTFAVVTRDPRRYGFHATLKALFRLRDGCGARALARAARRLAAAQPSITAAPLRPAVLPGSNPGTSFVALVPAAPCADLERLAEACVRRLDRYRARPRAADWRRRAAGLSPAERRHLRRWGYPYVGESFRFHLTLTGRLDRPLAARIRAALEAGCAPYDGGPLRVDALTLVREPAPGAAFVPCARYSLRSG